MGVDVRVVQWLRRHGHDAVHLREEGLHRAPDEQVFAKALAEDRIVLTFDLDFGDLAVLTREPAARETRLVGGGEASCSRAIAR